MKDKIHKELTNYLLIILEELLLEKSQEINVIDNIINHQGQTGCMKKYSFCQISDIDNKKWVCPKCHNKLPTINEINQQVNKSSNIKNTNKKSLVTYSNRFKELDMQESVSEIYMLQPYIISEENPSVEGYLEWVQNQTDPIYKLKANDHIFQSINGESTLSEEIKRFSEIAHMKRIELIKVKLIKKTTLDIWHLIPITCEEADLQKSKNSLTKPQILFIINSLIPSLDDSNRSRFWCLSSKFCNTLINILQEIRSVLAKNSININNKE
ncbi:14513_t:CDS:2 [Dentiscutata heterogama]|uniref:14513_t:CDS:1 n=1 Tax=Dentiscutata heterogama TaxID=1316150 RepID=A0ACA9M227_9GLOM|nr:14513_t:CDS:2 [Dentiscutata heterogama]